MSVACTPHTSPNPEEREAGLRRLVRRLLAEAGVPDAEAARQLGRPRQMLERQLSDDEHVYLRLSDLVVLERLAPGIADALLRSIGLRVAPERLGATAGDVLCALGGAMRAVAGAATEVTEDLPGGIDGAEAARIDRACEAIRRAVADLQASVRAAVVTR
jgi:hypothetical protein